MHEDQLDVTESTVRTLLDEQFPRWATLPVRRLQTAATVNAIFRVGDDLAERFPLLVQPPQRALSWLQAEKEAAEQLAASPIPTPLLLDGGGYSPADPALDLVGAWHLLDDTRRDIVRSALGCSDVQWQRGMAWAFEQAMGLVWYYADSNPVMSRWGRPTLDRPA
jgi:aminoglycoside phosphotransferase (APT) family kinase protein